MAVTEYQLEVKIPGATDAISDPATYIRYLFIFGLSLAAFLAVGAIVVGGVQYMISGTSITSVQQAKKLMLGSLTGVSLLAGAYLLLYTIDPSLVDLSLLPTSQIQAPDIPKIIENYDLSPEMTTGKTAQEINNLIAAGRITGQSGSTCGILTCGSQTVQGHVLSTGATAHYVSLRQNIQQACADQGLTCDTLITSTVDGQHASTCHKQGTPSSGTCGDFVITAPECGGSIKLCSAATKNKYIQIAANTIGSASAKDVSTCLNEYQVKGSSYSTGGHFHCNF